MIQVTAREELALEVLAARFRLGEKIWTFHSKHTGTLDDLERKGLVYTMHGIMSRTLRAGLTEEGQKALLSETYTPPMLAPPKPSDAAQSVRPPTLPLFDSGDPSLGDKVSEEFGSGPRKKEN